MPASTSPSPPTRPAERVLTDDMVARIRAFFPRYPTKRAVTLPALHIVHEELRCVPLAAVVEIAALLELAPSEVQDTLSFYQFFKQDGPHGRTRAWVCRSISCALRGGEDVLAHLCHRLGTKPGQASADGRITVEAAECLGACELAPCMLANDRLVANMTKDSADAFLTSLK